MQFHCSFFLLTCWNSDIVVGTKNTHPGQRIRKHRLSLEEQQHGRGWILTSWTHCISPRLLTHSSQANILKCTNWFFTILCPTWSDDYLFTGHCPVPPSSRDDPHLISWHDLNFTVLTTTTKTGGYYRETACRVMAA